MLFSNFNKQCTKFNDSYMANTRLRSRRLNDITETEQKTLNPLCDQKKRLTPIRACNKLKFGKIDNQVGIESNNLQIPDKPSRFDKKIKNEIVHSNENFPMSGNPKRNIDSSSNMLDLDAKKFIPITRKRLKSNCKTEQSKLFLKNEENVVPTILNEAVLLPNTMLESNKIDDQIGTKLNYLPLQRKLSKSENKITKKMSSKLILKSKTRDKENFNIEQQNCQAFDNKISSKKKTSTDIISESKIEQFEIADSSEIFETIEKCNTSVDLSIDEESIPDIQEQLAVLQNLQKKEQELETLILFEKLKKETPKITDENFLKTQIAELQNVLQKEKTDHCLREIMCSNGQLIRAFENISLLHKKKTEKAENLDSVPGYIGLILSLALKKKQLYKEISTQQQEILKIEEECHKLRSALENSQYWSASSLSKETDLKRLTEANVKRGSSIQLLAKITTILIEDIKAKSDVTPDLKLLLCACYEIENWDYEDIDQSNDLCTKVYSTKI